MTTPIDIFNHVSAEINKELYPKDLCPFCGMKQRSIADRNYLNLYGHCWSCDKQKWESGDLSLEEFEKRELYAARVS